MSYHVVMIYTHQNSHLLPLPPKVNEVMFLPPLSVCLFVCWFICLHDISKTLWTDPDEI